MNNDMPRDPLSPARAAKALETAGIALSDKHFRMILHYLQGDSKSLACEKAGLSPQSSWAAFNAPKIQAAMSVIIERFLVVEAAPAALRCLYEVVRDKKTAAGVRVSAANSLLDRAGFDTKRLSKAQEPGDKDISTMSADELRAEIAKLEREQNARMKDVSETDSEPIDQQVLDMFE